MPAGRPKKWTAERHEQAWETIRARLLDGETLTAILDGEKGDGDLPSSREFHRHCESDAAFWRRYQRAMRLSGLAQIETSGEPLEDVAKKFEDAKKPNTEPSHALVQLAKYRSDHRFRVGQSRVSMAEVAEVEEGERSSVTVVIGGDAAERAQAEMDAARKAREAENAENGTGA